jgi:hypothetical protein
MCCLLAGPTSGEYISTRLANDLVTDDICSHIFRPSVRRNKSEAVEDAQEAWASLSFKVSSFSSFPSCTHPHVCIAKPTPESAVGGVGPEDEEERDGAADERERLG